MLTNLKQRALISDRKEKKQEGIVYSNYEMSLREYILYGLQGLGIEMLFAYFFYHSYVAIIFLAPYILYFLKEKKKELCNARKRELCMQFREMILSLSACLYAGYSIENAFREVYKDMMLLYGTDALICNEIQYILSSLDNNVVLEKLLLELGERSGVSDIQDFGEIFAIGKRSSGDLKEMIHSSASVIGEKIEIKRDIITIMSAKVFEQKIMRVVPFGIILYISITSKGFFAPLYHNVAGIMIMTGCLFVYLLSHFLSVRITEIQL